MRISRQPALKSLGLGLGLAGSLLLALFGTVVGALALSNDGVRGTTKAWWFELHCSHSTGVVGFYCGLGLLVAGWLVLGEVARGGFLGPRTWWTALVVWGTPLVLGPPLFSRDLYSYVAQGLIAKAGHNPYTTSPQILGSDPVVAGIASVWRHTPAPYGPVAALGTEATAHLGGSSLFTQVIAARLPAVVGMVMVALLLPRLARRVGVNPGSALWLSVLSPLFIISFFASGHNDALMLGVMVGAALAITGGHWLLGVGLGTAAATVKLPAGCYRSASRPAPLARARPSSSPPSHHGSHDGRYRWRPDPRCQVRLRLAFALCTVDSHTTSNTGDALGGLWHLSCRLPAWPWAHCVDAPGGECHASAPQRRQRWDHPLAAGRSSPTQLASHHGNRVVGGGPGFTHTLALVFNVGTGAPRRHQCTALPGSGCGRQRTCASRRGTGHTSTHRALLSLDRSTPSRRCDLAPPLPTPSGAVR